MLAVGLYNLMVDLIISTNCHFRPFLYPLGYRQAMFYRGINHTVDKDYRVIGSIQRTMSTLKVVREKAIQHELERKQSRYSFKLAALEATLNNLQYDQNIQIPM